MVLNSAETGDSLKGEVYGVLNHPLSAFSSTLVKPARWCEMLMLHLNNRACRVDEAKKTLTLSVVRRYDIPVKECVRADLSCPRQRRHARPLRRETEFRLGTIRHA